MQVRSGRTRAKASKCQRTIESAIEMQGCWTVSAQHGCWVTVSVGRQKEGGAHWCEDASQCEAQGIAVESEVARVCGLAGLHGALGGGEA